MVTVFYCCRLFSLLLCSPTKLLTHNPEIINTVLFGVLFWRFLHNYIQWKFLCFQPSKVCSARHSCFYSDIQGGYIKTRLAVSCFVFYIQVFCAELSRGTFSLRSEQVSQKYLSLIMSQVISFFLVSLFWRGQVGMEFKQSKINSEQHYPPHPTPKKRKKNQKWENHNFALSVL